MNRDDVLRMAREAGIPDDNIPRLCHGRLETGVELLERFADLVAAYARIAAQIENEDLKARLAASGVAERRAVHEAVKDEHEACALVAEDGDHVVDVPGWHAQFDDANATARNIAASIRARGAA